MLKIEAIVLDTEVEKNMKNKIILKNTLYKSVF